MCIRDSFTGGVTAIAPSGVTLAGTIQTDGNAISIGDGNTAITLAANTIIDGDANNDQVTDGAITLGGTVNGTANLTLNSTNTTTISAAIGSGTNITSLTTDSGGATVISADITSTGNQTYNDNVSLTTDITLTGGAQLTFAGSVNSSVDGEGATDNDALSTSFTETAFEGEVGGNAALGAIIITGDLDLDAAITSASSLSVSTTSNLAADVTTTGTQTYGNDAASDATVTAGSRTLQGSTIQFASTVTGTTAATDDLTITGALDLDGAITDINDLYVSGTSNLGANITTTGTQEYNNNVTL